MIAHVFASGPSLHDFALSQDWTHKLTIACNGVPTLGLKTTAWVAIDPMPKIVVDWADEARDTLQFCTESNAEQFPRAQVLKHWGSIEPQSPREAQKSGYYWHGSVAHLAMEIARCLMGARDIVLWGVDYKDLTHAYDHVNGRLKRKDRTPWDMGTLEREFGIMAKTYKGWGIRVVNANPHSGLQVLRIVDPKLAYDENIGE